MKKRIFYFTIIIALSCSISSFAKRAFVNYPDEVIVSGIKYSTSYSEDLFFYKAYIEARDIKANKVLWKKQIYSIFLSPLKEHDVQFVMIKKVSYEKGSLLIVNENDVEYIMNLETLQIRKSGIGPLNKTGR